VINAHNKTAVKHGGDFITGILPCQNIEMQNSSGRDFLPDL
jgi:hypothetical protein